MRRNQLARNKWFLVGAGIVLAALVFFALAPDSPTPAAPAEQNSAPPEPPPQPPIKTEPARDNNTTILELFSPSDPYLTKQLNETALAQQIEQIITTSFVLTRCKIITEEDYRQNFYALINYALRMKLAPDAVQAEAKVRLIAESASTSYSLVYAQTPCDSPQLPIVAKQLLEWQKAYLPTPP